MSIILNKEELGINKLRKDALDILETGLEAINTEKILRNKIKLEDDILDIQGNKFDLNLYDQIFFVGIGKCAFDGARVIESILGNKLTNGAALDVKAVSAETLVDRRKIKSYVGTHPYPSLQNISATKEILEMLKDANENDLIITLISGGGSSLFDLPTFSVEKLIEITQILTEKGADIYELNTVRKHFSQIKGGQFTKICYPSQIVSLIFSDVLGNDISVIASGPTVLDKTTADDAKKVLEKYNIDHSSLKIIETPKIPEYFEKTKNILIASNIDALEAMEEKASSLGYDAKIETDRLSGEAKIIGKEFALRELMPKSCILFGGETTVKIGENKGKGGRNQTMILSALPYVKENFILACMASDGWDNTDHAGAIADSELLIKARSLNVSAEEYLGNNNSYDFFEKVGGVISTGRLESNVSDLCIMLSK